MNINEAIYFLKENNILVEFLNNTLPLDKVANIFSTEFGINIDSIKKYNPYKGDESDKYDFWILEFKDNINKDSLYLPEVRSFFKKYGWNLSRILNNNLIVHKDDEIEMNEFTHFVHMSTSDPHIILNSGLRPKSIHNRLYFFGFKTEVEYKSFIEESIFDTDQNPEYEEGRFYYFELTIPKNYKIYHDPEYMGETENQTPLYMYYGLPKEMIKYIGSE